MDSQHILYEKAKSLYSQLVEWRRHLHRYPELSFQEKNTAAFVISELKKINDIHIFSGKEDTGIETAVAAVLKKGDGPIIALRADMDALPIQEENDTEYASREENVMHACGHDAHTAILLGAAHVLAESDFNGTVKFLFQPAEEDTDEFGKSGAPYLIESGLLDDVSTAFALHMDPEIEPGHIKLHTGPSMANVDTFQGAIYGSGGHGAYPHLGTDPIWMLSFVIQAIQGITARQLSPLAPAVVSIGEVKAGSSTNVIPDKVTLQGTMRSYDDETRDQLETQLHQAFSTVSNLGGSYEVEVEKGEPALTNDETAVRIYEQTIQDVFPTFRIIDEPYGLGGEDFGYIAKHVPAAMIFLGAGFSESENRGLHMPNFDIQEDILPVGTSLLAGAALRALQAKTLTNR
ncbi:M20 metallopeptidase family protein [Bacillus piscicola]|uniref:M20 metallopeptidase family protein n=1 Tax=Bacillus piscicola TaxID=1632684 RepID=UPI001F0A049D|nr:amidohydrolase [Bacillus piscicola]